MWALFVCFSHTVYILFMNVDTRDNNLQICLFLDSKQTNFRYFKIGKFCLFMMYTVPNDKWPVTEREKAKGA